MIIVADTQVFDELTYYVVKLFISTTNKHTRKSTCEMVYRKKIEK